MDREIMYKMQSALQIATNALNEIKKNPSGVENYRIAEGALEYIKEKTAMTPNKAELPKSTILYAKDCHGQGMGFA